MNSSAIDILGTRADCGTGVPPGVFRASVCRPGFRSKRQRAARHSGAHKVLVIGYGNTLRKDDGAGPVMVSRLKRAFIDAPGIRFITAHQLLPELAAEMNVDRVIFLDASVELPPGAVRVCRVQPGKEQRTAVTHHVAGGYLLALAKAIHGGAPRAVSIAIGAGDLSLGEELSPAVECAAAALVTRLGRYLLKFVARETEVAEELPFMD